MKYSFFFIGLLWMTAACSKDSSLIEESQTTVKTHRVAMTERHSLDGKLFNANTGEAISMEDFSKMLQENPEIQLERFYNKYGITDKFLYHPDAPTTNFSKRDASKQPQIGQVMPEFVFTSIEGKEIASEELKGKWVLIRFDFYTAHMDMDRYSTFAKEIESIPRSAKLTTVLCSIDTEENLEKELGYFSDKIELVANGQGFAAKYHVRSFPTTILIGPDQKVVEYIGRDQMDQIKSIIKSK